MTNRTWSTDGRVITGSAEGCPDVTYAFIPAPGVDKTEAAEAATELVARANRVTPKTAERRDAILALIESFRVERHRSPSYREIAAAMNVSRGTAQTDIVQLEAAGDITVERSAEGRRRPNAIRIVKAIEPGEIR